MKLNIGCGRDYRKDWINIDISKEVKAEHYLDIRKDKLPFDNGSVEEIYISGVLEQILVNEDLIFSMNELYRVLRVGGEMIVIVPSAKFSTAHQDPMDCRKFTERTFEYFLEASREYKLYGSVYGFKGWGSCIITTNERGIMTIKMKK